MEQKSKKEKKKRKKKKKENPVKDQLKEEVARELGLENDINERGWSNLTSRETGKIGGHIAQRLKDKK